MHKDERGRVSFVNDFNFPHVKRFYVVETRVKGSLRGWHGHRHEGKYVFPIQGKAIVAAVEVDNWESPSKNIRLFQFILNSAKPCILYIPPGFANGFKSHTMHTKLMFFSTSTLEDSLIDDIRFPADYWTLK